jgi:demethylspheroidene O-methyltransferase
MNQLAAVVRPRRPWTAWRDRLLASPRFARWALAFPLTRPLVRHYERRLFDLMAGFTYSQVLAALVQLRVLDRVAEAPQTADELAPQLALSPAATATLLDAAVALRLLERDRDGVYAPGLLGTVLRTQPGIQAMVEHHGLLYADLQDPVALLRGHTRPTQLSRFWTYSGNPDAAELTPAQVASYSTLMSVTQRLIADQILDAYPIARHARLLDVGGGEGTFLLAAAARAPQLQLMLFDLPAVAERARARFEAAGVAGRAQCFSGDFRATGLPTGADAISLIRVAFDHDDATVLALLRAAHAALPLGGTLLLAEPMVVPGRDEPSGAAYFGLYLMAMGPGRPRSAERLAALISTAGFADVQQRHTRTPLQVGLLSARKAAL